MARCRRHCFRIVAALEREAKKHLLVNCATVSLAELLLIVDILGINLPKTHILRTLFRSTYVQSAIRTQILM